MLKRSPEALAIVSFILILFVGLTWLIPGGEFARADFSGNDAVISVPLEEAERLDLEEGKSTTIAFLARGQKVYLECVPDGELVELPGLGNGSGKFTGDHIVIPATAFGVLEDKSNGNFSVLFESIELDFRKGRSLVIPDSYKRITPSPQGLKALLLAPIRGFTDHHAALVIAFVLLVGGAFSILTATGAIDSAFGRLLAFAVRRPKYKKFMIPLLMTIFSLAGCTFGMSEEVLVFVLVTLPLSKSLGYDRIVGVAIPFVGAGAGFAGAAINPFTVGIAQGIAQLPPGSGAGYRWLVWVVYTVVAIAFVMWYAKRIDKDPKLGFKADEPLEASSQDQNLDFNRKRIFILLMFMASLVLLMVGAQNWDWYIEEISALFVALGILSAIVSHLGVNDTVKAFTNGAKDMLPAALIIGLSKSILVVAEEGRIIDSVLHAMASSVGDLPAVISVQLMFFVQGAINFFIPSGSGQAAITMPIMSPLADLLGIGRQTAVLAYQFGDGLFNLVIPTSGVTMGVLSIAGIPFSTWIKWVWKLMILLILVSMICLALPLTVFTWT